MEKIKEIVQVISKYKLRPVDILGDEMDSNNRYAKFYQGLVEGNWQNDRDAALSLFGKKETTPAYIKFKRNFLRRLLNSIFFIDLNTPQFNEHQRAYYNCYKNWAAAKILIGRSATSAAMDLSEKIFKVAQRYEFTELIVDISSHLRRYYGTVKGNRKKYNAYKRIHRSAVSLWQCELLAQEYYEELTINYVNSSATRTRASL